MKLAFLLAAVALALAVPATAAGEQVGVSSRQEADGTTTQTHEVIVPASVDQVWQAISTPLGWMTWAVPAARITADDPDVMETSYDPGATPGGPQTIQQRFLARIPNHLLVFRTIKAPEGFPHWDEYRQVTSVFELQPDLNGTRVRLYSTGYPDTEGGRELLKFFGTGNAETLQHLQLRFADGPRVWK